MKKWTTADMPEQTGKLAIVTGATGDIGFQAARALAMAGAQVILAVRDFKKGNAAEKRIRESASSATVISEYLDLASLESVAEFAERMIDCYSAIDLLVNNAAEKPSSTRHTTQDGFELQFGTNYLGHFALTGRLLPLLARGRSRRVVNAACLTQSRATVNFDDLQSERHYDKCRAHSQSKLAMLIFARELERLSRAHGWGVQSNAAHPGLVRSSQPAQGRGEPQERASWWARRLSFMSQPASEAALPLLYAATDYAATGGTYYGPRGSFELRGAPGHARVAPAAADQAVAERLWTVSERLTGVQFSTGAR